MAEVTQQLIDVVEKCKWPEDTKQDFYVMWLELPEEEAPDFENSRAMRSYANHYMYNIRRNETAKTSRQASLRTENAEAIMRGMALDGQGEDPAEILEGEQHILKQYNDMSPLLQETLIQYYVEGRTPEDIAGENWEEPGAVRKRITRARNQLKGETYE